MIENKNQKDREKVVENITERLGKVVENITERLGKVVENITERLGKEGVGIGF